MRHVLLLSLTCWLTACAASQTPPPAPPTGGPPVRVSTSLPTGPAATPAPANTPTPLPSPTATPGSGPGAVSGSVCYPGFENPPLRLTVENVTTGKQIVLDIPQGQPDYRLELPPGNYLAYAETTGTGLRGSYARDGHLQPFTVPPGGSVSGIDLCDWYRRPAVLPPADGQPNAVTVTTLQKMNLHPAPTLAEPPLQTLPAGITAPAVARSGDDLWLQIEPPAGEPAWIYAPLTLVQGHPDTLPIVGPATPADAPPQFVPAPYWSYYSNVVLGHFKGQVLDQAQQPVNGYSVLLSNGTWSVLSHPSGPSRHYPDYAPGAWDVVFVNPSDLAGWWALTVVRYDCPNFQAGFDAQCKQFTLLSRPKVVKIIYPDATVLEQADWLCRRDCDQGVTGPQE